MKTLKFFLMAFIAISFFACEQHEEPGTKPGDQNDTTDTTDTVVPNPVTLSFSLTFDGKEIKEGDVLNVTMDHYAWGELVADVFLTNNADEAKDFTVKEVRNYDYTKYQPAFCVTTCNPSNGQKEELWTVGSLEAEQEQELAMHLRVSNYEEVDGEYVEVLQETATCPGVFTVSNGEESLTFTLNFVYVKEEVPAE
ncbi:MAG: hypothetical protein J6B65_03985 [Paludibacteraceae bacterium]|nr:hypothetical protein [Paludibacteraceae bacterium]